MKGICAVLHGMNDYGFKFTIPVVIENWQQTNNTQNSMKHCFYASACFEKIDAEHNFSPMSFYTKPSKNIGLAHKLFWTEIEFLDGTKIKNCSFDQLIKRTQLNRELIECKYGKAISQSLNEYVGYPVVAHNNQTGATRNGILLAVEPRKDNNPMAYILVNENTTYMLPVDNKNTIAVYSFDKNDMPKNIKLNAEELSF